MWNAQLVGKIREQDRLKVNVRFFNDADEIGTQFVQEFIASAEVGTIEWLKKQVHLKLQALTTLDQTVASLPEGAVASYVAPVPTAEEIARDLYITKLETYRHALKGVEYGILTGNETQITTLKQWLIDNFQDAYIKLF